MQQESDNCETTFLGVKTPNFEIFNHAVISHTFRGYNTMLVKNNNFKNVFNKMHPNLSNELTILYDTFDYKYSS